MIKQSYATSIKRTIDQRSKFLISYSKSDLNRLFADKIIEEWKQFLQEDMILSEGENSMKLEINDDEAYLDIRREFIEENVQKFEAMLRDILFNQKIKEVKITIRTDAIDHDIQIKRYLTLRLSAGTKLPDG